MSTLTSHYYDGIAEPGRIPALAIMFSVAFHAALVLGISRPAWVRPVFAHEKPDTANQFFQVDLKDDPEPNDQPKQKADLAAPVSAPVPVLPDVPVVALPNDFRQEFIPPVPNTDDLRNLRTIPQNIRRGPVGTDGARVFDQIDLDKKPEAISRTSPTFPYEMQREVAEATVVVGFIVDKHGDVLQAHIVSCSHAGFERAALTAVEKWKFRPGIKNNQKVSTRVEQPLSFVLQDGR